jgi:hypothetical protein
MHVCRVPFLYAHGHYNLAAQQLQALMPYKTTLPLLLFLAFITIASLLFKACQYPKGYYSSPLNMPVDLAANFGEVRAEHYHMGLDIRTNGQENLPVFAAADGYISRVTIEETGFGHAVYITHPNATISVYGHLNRFMPQLEKAVKAKQYKNEKWLIDTSFTANSFPVKKGMLVAYSGNTGSSQGPHLHFEVKDARTGNNLNPLLNGLPLKDNIAPVINSLYLYDRTKSIYETEATPIFTANDNEANNSNTTLIKTGSPRVSIGIDATDKNADTRYKLGIQRADIIMDDVKVFCFTINSLGYKDTRYVNACIDYRQWHEQYKCIQLLCRLPGNRLQVFEGSPGDGTLNIEDGKTHHVTVNVYDAAGNTATSSFNIKYDAIVQKNNIKKKGTQLMLPGKNNTARTKNAVALFTSKAFYDTVNFAMHEETSTEYNTASPLVYLHNAFVPVHDSYLLKIQTTLPATSPLRQHTIMQLTTDKQTIYSTGRWDGNTLAGYFNALGTAQLVTDTVDPTVTLMQGDNHRFTDNETAMHIKYTDNLGYAAYFRATLDGHWLLFEKKCNLFTCYFDKHCPPGKHTLQVTVKDLAGNTTTKAFAFTRE